ncbi:hypothetical protein [Streptomyces sp. LUP30]|uniref:hypothetical protein n=1 Tax=Streptomyces sp. LUP30 TaxID=1890285 RepID=UPI001C40432D|nr:hypothetical protein [Streptomyces sp. LUP30]
MLRTDNAGGCSSCYLEADGVDRFSWPQSTRRMRRRLDRFDAEACATTRPPSSGSPQQ